MKKGEGTREGEGPDTRKGLRSFPRVVRTVRDVGQTSVSLGDLQLQCRKEEGSRETPEGRREVVSVTGMLPGAPGALDVPVTDTDTVEQGTVGGSGPGGYVESLGNTVPRVGEVSRPRR